MRSDKGSLIEKGKPSLFILQIAYLKIVFNIFLTEMQFVNFFSYSNCNYCKALLG